jgi:hypothetical protein
MVSKKRNLNDVYMEYERHARTCSRTDFWGQVRRTVNGEPVSQEQIEMIVSAVKSGLSLSPEDYLLDLCCGNGALSHRFFSSCRSGLGVDISETLISVAREHFGGEGNFSYREQDVIEFLASETEPERFTCALCYGSLAGFRRPDAEKMLSLMRSRFTNIGRFMIGNIPDRERLFSFFSEETYEEGIEDRPDSKIGIWWSREEILEVATKTGWAVQFSMMPSAYFTSHYRFDALLTNPSASDHV